jgi:uncharacterized membrane protein YbaN (DUF454 family)
LGVEPPADPTLTPDQPAAAPDRSRPLRIAFAVIGTIALAIGVLGIVLPILPTTPFLLLAAACYARASTRLYGWLLGQSALGPIIARWRESGSLAPGVKVRAIVIVVVTFSVSILLVDALLVRALLLVTAAIVTVFLARLPTAP